MNKGLIKIVLFGPESTGKTVLAQALAAHYDTLWVPEFARHGENSFLISPASRALSVQDQDENEGNRMFEILENEILPKYYNAPEKWMKMVKQAMKDVAPAFESGRMVKEYYEKLYAK